MVSSSYLRAIETRPRRLRKEKGWPKAADQSPNVNTDTKQKTKQKKSYHAERGRGLGAVGAAGDDAGSKLHRAGVVAVEAAHDKRRGLDLPSRVPCMGRAGRREKRMSDTTLYHPRQTPINRPTQNQVKILENVRRPRPTRPTCPRRRRRRHRGCR